MTLGAAYDVVMVFVFVGLFATTIGWLVDRWPEWVAEANERERARRDLIRCARRTGYIRTDSVIDADDIVRLQRKWANTPRWQRDPSPKPRPR